MKIIIGSTDWALIEVLTASGELNRNDLKGATKEMLKKIDKNASDRAIDKRIAILKEAGILACEKVGKYALYRISSEADFEYIGVDLQVKKGEKNDHIRENSIARYLLCKDHTSEVKKIIKQWIGDFPTISIYGVHLPDQPDKPLRRPMNRLPFESELQLLGFFDEFLFNDLLFHLEKQDKKIVELLKEFEEMCVELHSKIEALISEIAKDVTEQINSAIAKETGNIKLKIVDRWEVNSISKNFLIRIYDACIMWAEDMENFSIYYKNYGRSTIGIQSLLGYSLEYQIEGVAYVWIKQGLLEAEEFKNKIDDVMNKMIEKSKKDYYPKGKEIVNLIEKLEDIKDEIIRFLKKQLSFVVFKGECEYLRGYA